MNIGQIIYELRMKKGIYQKELAVYLKVSIGTISNYEKGIHYPDLNTLCKLADYFGVTTDYLLGRTDYRNTPEILQRPITKDYTVAELVDTTLELSSKDADRLIDYLELLKQCRSVNFS